MVIKNEYQITQAEAGITLVSTIFGVAVLRIPSRLANEVGTADGWISVIIAGLITMLLIYLYIRLQRNFPYQSYLQYIGRGKVGKWGAKTIALLWIIWFLIALGTISRMLAITLEMYLINQTPSEVVVGVFLLVVAYGVSKGLQGVIHIHLLFTPIILLTVLFAIIFNVGNTDFEQLLPIMSEGVFPVLSGVLPAMFPFSAFLVYFFIMKQMRMADIRALPQTIFMGAAVFIFVLLTVTTYAVFGTEMTKLMVFPSVELAKEIEIAGGFIERLESLFLTIYIMAIFTSMLTVLYVVHYVMNEQFLYRKPNPWWLHPIVVFVIFIIAFIPDSISESDFLNRMLTIYIIILNVGTIGIGYLTVWIRNRKQSM
ncbi:GerAB/ArcD/ProY family transporter [Anaerobacillus sp. MEB173]|uniref:GerAB/ArcD/ProY family transporter n=1 Tax=Anaerobacillus sp. MEB173 TaxID=3383345 RepID=UPI003F904427